MAITREQIAQRRDELIARRDKVQAQAYGLTGAIQDCEFWLAELDQMAGAVPEESEQSTEPSE